MKKLAMSSLLAAMLSTSLHLSAQQVDSDTSTTSHTQTRGYVGFQWNLGGSLTPEVVLGIMNAKIKSNGNTEGANLALHLNFENGFAPGGLRLSYLNGKEDYQGQIGAGYNFINGAPMLILGVNAPYSNAGVEFYSEAGFVPYIQLHSRGKFNKPEQATDKSSGCTEAEIREETCFEDLLQPPLQPFG